MFYEYLDKNQIYNFKITQNNASNIKIKYFICFQHNVFDKIESFR